jgi:hypothetical protein
MKTGEIVVEERPAADYTRFDAAPGQEFPDFAFTDFNGGRHKLSDFRGKVVLARFLGHMVRPVHRGNETPGSALRPIWTEGI